MNFLNQLSEFESVNPPETKTTPLPPGFDCSKLIRNLDDCRPEMKRRFREGKRRGETTHIAEVDRHFTWKKGFLVALTGWPQHGKSELALFLALTKSLFSGWKWLVYSPEAGNAEELYDQLAHTYIGQSTDPFYKNQMTEKEYDIALDFIKTRFLVIDDDLLDEYELEPSPEVLRAIAEQCKTKFNIDGVIKDNWNNLIHDLEIRDDKYLQVQLRAEKRMSIKLDIVNIILVHPRSWAGPFPEDGVPIPKPNMIANGAMWDNKCDVIGAVHRPNYHKDRTDREAIFETHKVKQQKLVGLPGRVEMYFNPTENRYYINGRTPIAPVGLQPDYLWKDLPESGFEKQTTAPF
jgi:hypothetical protein